MQAFQQPTKEVDRAVQIFFGLLAYQFSQYCSWTLGNLNNKPLTIPSVLWPPFFEDSLSVANFYFISLVTLLALTIMMPKWSPMSIVTSIVLAFCCYIDFLWRGYWPTFLLISIASFLFSLRFFVPQRYSLISWFDPFFLLQILLIFFLLDESYRDFGRDLNNTKLIWIVIKVSLLLAVFALTLMPKKTWINCGWALALVAIGNHFFLNRVDPFLLGPLVSLWFYGSLLEREDNWFHGRFYVK